VGGIDASWVALGIVSALPYFVVGAGRFDGRAIAVRFEYSYCGVMRLKRGCIESARDSDVGILSGILTLSEKCCRGPMEAGRRVSQSPLFADKTWSEPFPADRTAPGRYSVCHRRSDRLFLTRLGQAVRFSASLIGVEPARQPTRECLARTVMEVSMLLGGGWQG